MVTWGRKEEPHQGQVERQRERQDLVGVELTPAVPSVGSFDRGNAGLGESLAEQSLERSGGLVLSPSPEFSGSPKVVGDHLVEVGLSRPRLCGRLEYGAGPLRLATDHAPSLVIASRMSSHILLSLP